MAATTPDLGFKPKGLYIGGEWKRARSGETIVTKNPANADVLGEVPIANEDDVDDAVQAAKGAFPEWAAMPITERAKFLNSLANAVDENSDQLALMDSVDSGNAISAMRGDMKWTSDALRYFAGLMTEIKGETLSREQGHLNLTMRQPYGVVAKINPFNHPFRFCAEKAAAPAGCGQHCRHQGARAGAPLKSETWRIMRWDSSAGRRQHRDGRRQNRVCHGPPPRCIAGRLRRFC